jgi:hypothetical protein
MAATMPLSCPTALAMLMFGTVVVATKRRPVT